MQITNPNNGRGRDGPIALSLLDFCAVTADGNAEGGLALLRSVWAPAAHGAR